MKKARKSRGKSNHTRVLPPWVYPLLEDYKLSLEVLNRSLKTIQDYLANLQRYFESLFLMNLLKPIAELGRSELRSYIKHLQNSQRWPNRPELGDKGTLSPVSIQVHIRAIKAFWSWLEREGYVEKNALAKFPLPKAPIKLMGILSAQQISLLLSCIDRSTLSGDRNHLIILMLYDLGLRITELLNIKVGDLDFAGGYVTIMGKGQKQRSIPISKISLREILRYISKYHPDQNPDKSARLFELNGHKPISSNGVQQMLHRLRDAAGLEDIRVSPHVFRHSFATQFIANGGNAFVLQRILGHSSINMTLRYTHLQPEDLRVQHSQFSPVGNLYQKR